MDSFQIFCKIFISVLIFSFVILNNNVLSTEKNDWENPEIVGINKELPHCTLVPYNNVTKAIEGERSASKYYKSLDGDWKFHWSSKPDDRPKDFYKFDYDDSGWDKIPVPSNWQMFGYDKDVWL